MKSALANAVRADVVSRLYNFLSEGGEDVGMIESNSFNFPITIEGEEGFVEVVVKVPKDGGDDNYLKREVYADKVRERAEKKAEREKAAAEKKAKAEAAKKAKAEKKAE